MIPSDVEDTSEAITHAPVEHLKRFPPGARIVDGMLVFMEDGRQIISSFDSSNNCSGVGLMDYIERCRQSDTDARKIERAEAAQAARKQRAEDIKVLGPLYGELATLIRKNRAAAAQAVTRRKSIMPAALRRTRRRRRRHIKNN